MAFRIVSFTDYKTREGRRRRNCDAVTRPRGLSEKNKKNLG